jgi:hypothetical protein
MEHRMAKKHKIRKHVYKIGDLVKVQIARIDRGPGDRNALPCKVITVLEDNMYRLACRFGVLRNAFAAGEILPLGPQEFADLEDPPMDQEVTLVEAARLQSAAHITCSCKGSCLTTRCKCRKENIPCGSKCHPKSNSCKHKS